MDLNLTLLDGRLALPPVIELQPDGSERAALLVYVRSDRRARFDVIPVVVPECVGIGAVRELTAGTRVFVSGALLRSCSHELWESTGRIEVVAEALRLPDVEDGRFSE